MQTIVNPPDSLIFFKRFMPKKKKKVVEKDDEREGWGNSCGFFLASLGYTIGLSCVWRFPTQTYQDGGGAFLIPYVIFSLVIGIPLVFLEMSVGQYTSTGTLSCWTMSKAFRGVGIAMNISNAYVCIYYNMVIAYALYFLVLSFTKTLPWQTCNPSWASPNCVDNYSSSVFKYTPCEQNYMYQCSTGRCLNNTLYTNDTDILDLKCRSKNASDYIGWYNPTFPSQDFWIKVVLQKTNSIENFGGLIWQLVLALFVAWLIVLLLIVKGVEGTGKVVYVTTTFPYILLLILGIQGWRLDGAAMGIKYYLTPDLSKLASIQVWYDAATQVFYTLSISYGGLLTYASFNRFNAPILRDSIILAILSCLTSIFCGFVVFPYLGYLAKNTGQPIDNIVQSDVGFAFIIFPYAVSTLKVAPLWSVLFFVMVLVIGVDNMMASTETAVTALSDVIPALKKTNFRRYATSAGVCVFYFLVGLLYCTRSGIYWVELFDNYSGNWGVLMTASIECLSVAVFYGFKNFRTDLSAMIGVKVANNKFFNILRVLWMVVCPVILLFLVVYSFVTFSRTTMGNYLYPVWADVLGMFMNFLVVISIIIYAFYVMITTVKDKQPLKHAIEPASTWIPLRLKDRVRANLVKFNDNYEKHSVEIEIERRIEEDVLNDKKDKKDKIKSILRRTNLPVDVTEIELATTSRQVVQRDLSNMNRTEEETDMNNQKLNNTKL